MSLFPLSAPQPITFLIVSEILQCLQREKCFFGGGVLDSLVFQFLCFVECGAFSGYITLCLKLKVEEDGTQIINYMQEGIAISGFVLWLVFFFSFLFLLPQKSLKIP